MPLSPNEPYMKKFLYLYVVPILFVCCFSCGVSRPSFDPARKYAPEALQKDYQLFRHILEELHPSLYWYTSRDSMNYFFDKGYAQLNDSMTESQFRTLLSYVISKVDCGHTSVRYSKDYGKYLDTAKLPQFPLILKWWKDTMVVAANLNRRDSILKRGTVIESINGWTTPQLIDTLFNYFVTDGYNLTGKYQYLSSGLNFSYWYKNVIGFSDSFRIAYLDSNRMVKETRIALYDPKADTLRRIRPLSGRPEPEPGRRKRRKRERFLTRNLVIDSASNTGFMTINTFENGNRLVRFFHRSFRMLDEQRVQNLVIDVRSNGGGDATNSTLLTRYLIDKKFKVADSLYTVHRHSRYDKYIGKGYLYDFLMMVVSSKRADGKYHFRYFERHHYSPVKKHHFDGQVYILTGGNSFSATCLFAGAVKGQKNISLVGEETGGGYYGNTAWMIPDVTLPVTGVRFRLPRFRLVVDGTREKNGAGVLPDVAVPPTVDAIMKGVDFKTAAAKDLIRSHASVKK